VKVENREVLFITDLNLNRVFKTTLDGEILMELTYPKSTGKYANEKEFRPSWTLHLPNGEFFVLDGYGKDYILRYDRQGKLLNCFGGPEGGIAHWGPHGGVIDSRDAKDRLAWEQFVGLYAPLVYGFARKKGLQDADAADIAQDVLTSVAQQMRQWEFDPQRGSFRGWHGCYHSATMRCWQASQVGRDPRFQFLACQISGSQRENDGLSVIDICNNLKAIENQEDFHCRMANSFIAVNEGMIHDQRETQYCGLGMNVGIKFVTTEAHLRLRDCRFDTAQIKNAFSTSRQLHDATMQVKHLRQCEVAHQLSRR
jgi:hypothetical protein